MDIITGDALAQVSPAPTPEWREENGVRYFSVTSNGRSGQDWIDYLQELCRPAGSHAGKTLLSPDFFDSSWADRITTELAVVLGFRFTHEERVTSSLIAFGVDQGWHRPAPDVACLIRDKFTDKQLAAMGVGKALNVLCKPLVPIPGEDPVILSVNRTSTGGMLGAPCGKDDGTWIPQDAFCWEVKSYPAK
jgi:hypothetical protein